MGLHIIVEDYSGLDSESKRLPPDAEGWDSIRHGGDRNAIVLFRKFGYIQHAWDYDRYRPQDLGALHTALGVFEDGLGYNEGRWTGLIELLQANANLWLYESW